jgi:hypothetical protein
LLPDAGVLNRIRGAVMAEAAAKFEIPERPAGFNWNDLVFFLELARQGRLMPAARRLKVDHTTVSRRIGELEKDLGLKLFERKPDGFVMRRSFITRRVNSNPLWDDALASSKSATGV